MKVVFCSAEVAPFSQAGGLGDVIGSLPKALSMVQELEVSVFTPMYGMIDPVAHKLEETGIRFDITMHQKAYPISIWKGFLPQSPVSVYFVENHALYGARKEVYPYGQPEWELEGFLVFSQAIFEALRHLGLQPDILHAHDWHTASVATTLAERRMQDPFFAQTRSVLTIHNLQYQGVFGETNWLRDGILQADAVTTVSPNYAREIQTPEYGAGLHEALRERTGKNQNVSGILNGIDTTLYNPQTDAFIMRHYDRESVSDGKAACKRDLQMTLGLPIDPDTPLLGFVGRLTDQKGLDILLPAIDHFQEQKTAMQWAILGTGDPTLEAALRERNKSTETVRSYLGFNTAMAMKIYAAADMFVMPSAFEPCGLGQMIALRYGSVPVVRAVGGLADTIFDVRKHPETGNGFSFSAYDSHTLQETIRAALSYYADKTRWPNLIRRGMAEDHGWGQSAQAYKVLYDHLLAATVPV